MSRAIVPWLLLCLAGAAYADDPPPEARVFVEVGTARDTVYVGEVFQVTLRVGFDPAFFDAHGVTLFRQAMDVPLSVKAPWLDRLDGATGMPADDALDGPRMSLALGDDVAALQQVADRVVDGRTYTVLEVRRRYLADASTTLQLEAPTLQFAHATRFDEDFLGGRVPVDRRDVTVRGEALSIDVRALPADGRPAGFAGAIGRYVVRAFIGRSAAEVGAIVRFTLTIEGDGNLETLDAPRLVLDGFHVYGAIDDPAARPRVITYEIAATDSGASEVPAVPFAFFDPGPPPAYRVVSTAPIPFAVTPRPGPTEGEPVPAVSDPPEPDSSASWIFGVFGVVVAITAVLVAGNRRRARAGDAVDPREERRRVAVDALRAAANEPGPELADVFTGFLAACLDCPAAAVIGPGLGARLEAVGASSELARRAAESLERLVGARYGGTPERLDPRLTEELVILCQTQDHHMRS